MCGGGGGGGGSVQVFLRKPLARCDFQEVVFGPPVSTLAHAFGIFFTCIFTSCADPESFVGGGGVQL